MLPTSLYLVLLSYLLLPATAGPPLQATPVKFPWIHKFASIGDSYAAGLGAGNRIDWACPRYGKSYPNLLQSSYLGDHQNRTHQFLACSGATSPEILEKQVPLLENNTDLLTISAGGNDIGLTPILNNCVYQFYMATEDDCKDAMIEARKRVANETELAKSITDLIVVAAPKMNQTHGIIYVTGYAGFFGVEDDACDNVTWAVWRDLGSNKQFLGLAMRRELNHMVREVNKILRRVTDAAGPNIRFIDYDKDIEQARGRYCESGIFEPDPNRQGLSFYEWDTVDPGDNVTELFRTGDDVLLDSFEGAVAEQINRTLQEHPDWQFYPNKGFVNKSKIRPEGIVDDTIWWLLPDSWKRVFHLRPEAHHIIAKLVVDDLEDRAQGRDTVTLLVFIAVGGLVVVVALLLLLLLLRRRDRRGAYAPVGSEGQMDTTADYSDDETLADSSEDMDPKSKLYGTFE